MSDFVIHLVMVLDPMWILIKQYFHPAQILIRLSRVSLEFRLSVLQSGATRLISALVPKLSSSWRFCVRSAAGDSCNLSIVIDRGIIMNDCIVAVAILSLS